MEFLIELLVELILEGSIEISENKRITKWIRYPVIFLIVSIFAIVILGLIILGIYVLKDALYIGLFFIIIGLILLILAIRKFTQKYIQSKNIFNE